MIQNTSTEGPMREDIGKHVTKQQIIDPQPIPDKDNISTVCIVKRYVGPYVLLLDLSLITGPKNLVNIQK